MATDRRITHAKRVGAEAIERAARARMDPSKNRSTATRAAYKEKAEGLDQVLRILSARPGRRG